MNIFVSDEDPVQAARNLDDRRLVKMTLETAQLLSTALDRTNHPTQDLYRPTHREHPCSVWASLSLRNFDWLVQHGIALGEEYTFRFGKKHQSSFVIQRAAGQADPLRFPSTQFTPFAKCNPYRELPVVQSYRSYLLNDKWGVKPYNHDKFFSTKWTKRGCPDWAQS